jgi:hypothetical protein
MYVFQKLKNKIATRIKNTTTEKNTRPILKSDEFPIPLNVKTVMTKKVR